jgi:hypothetical protein
MNPNALEQIAPVDAQESFVAHAVSCGNAACKKKSCQALKVLLVHGKTCNVKVAGGCKECASFWKVLTYHAKACRNPVCEVPHCRDLQQTSVRSSLIRNAKSILRMHSPISFSSSTSSKSSEDEEEKEEEIEDVLNDCRPHSTKVMDRLVSLSFSDPQFIAENPLYEKCEF